MNEVWGFLLQRRAKTLHLVYLNIRYIIYQIKMLNIYWVQHMEGLLAISVLYQHKCTTF